MVANDAVQARTTPLFGDRNTVHLSPLLIVSDWLEEPLRYLWAPLNRSSVKKGITVHEGEKSLLSVPPVTSAQREPTSQQNAASDPIVLPELSRICLFYP